ncbi:MAG: hypothetical protein KJ566_01450 [Nanoarchaeota archaeon]|nr:hypothetical protein [Nanoarchaeota archaeon]
MKIEQSTIQKTFVVEHKGRIYNIDYLNSDGQILGLINRNNWEVFDENSEELKIYLFQEETKREKENVKKNKKLFIKLIKFCIKHFEYYNPIKEK